MASRLARARRGADVHGGEFLRLQCGVDGRHVLLLKTRHQDVHRPLRSALEQQKGGIGVAVHERHPDRPEAVERVTRVDVRATVEQELDHLDLALVGGKEQRRGLVAIAGIDVGAGLERFGGATNVAGACGGPEFLDGRGGLRRWGGRLLRALKQKAECQRQREASLHGKKIRHAPAPGSTAAAALSALLEL